MSLELEVSVKVQKPFTEDDIEGFANDRIIGKTPAPVININDEEMFEYRRFVLRLEQIEGRGDFDGRHTVIYLPYGVFLIDVNFDKFNHIYETMTGSAIRRTSDFKFTTKK